MRKITNLVKLQNKLLKKKLNKDKSLKNKHKFNLKKLRLKTQKDWCLQRRYREYNKLFSQFLKKNLIEEIYNIYKSKINKKEKFKVLEEGAGFGLFLVDLKKKLKDLNINSQITALTINTNKIINEAKKKKYIDKIRKGASETFTPNKKYDVIFSLYGGIHYTIKEIKKEQLLKYSYSLNKGGMAFIGLDISNYRSGSSKRDIRGDIEKAFHKRGFAANFYENKINYSSGMKLPKDVLIIKRW